ATHHNESAAEIVDIRLDHLHLPTSQTGCGNIIEYDQIIILEAGERRRNPRGRYDIGIEVSIAEHPHHSSRGLFVSIAVECLGAPSYLHDRLSHFFLFEVV